MNKKTKKVITMLATFIFSDIEFKKLMSYLSLNLLNSARLYVEEKLELLETTVILFAEDAVINLQIKKCRKLDDIITDVYISSLTHA
jgi:hypothetical protein